MLNWDGGSQGKLLLNPMTRRGGYLTTVDQAEKFDKTQEEAMEKMMELAIGNIPLPVGKGGKEGATGSPAGKPEKIPANTGASPSASAKEEKVLPQIRVLI